MPQSATQAISQRADQVMQSTQGVAGVTGTVGTVSAPKDTRTPFEKMFGIDLESAAFVAAGMTIIVIGLIILALPVAWEGTKIAFAAAGAPIGK